MQTGFFSTAAFLQRADSRAGGENRSLGKGSLAHCLGGMFQESFISPGQSSPVGAGHGFSAVYRSRIKALANAGRPVSQGIPGDKPVLNGRGKPQKTFPERQASPGGKKTGFATATASTGTVPVEARPANKAGLSPSSGPAAGQEGHFPAAGEAGAASAGGEELGLKEELSPLDLILQPEGRFTSEENAIPPPAGDQPEGTTTEEMLPLQGISEEAAAGGVASPGQNAGEPGPGESLAAEGLFPEGGHAGSRASPAGITENAAPEHKDPARWFSRPSDGAGLDAGDGPVSGRQLQLQDEVQLTEQFSAIRPEEELPGALLSGEDFPGGIEAGAETENLAGVVVREGDEAGEIPFGRHAGFPGEGEIGKEEAGNKVPGDMETASGGKREKSGVFPGEAASSAKEPLEPGIDLFSAGKQAEPIIPSLQNQETFVGGAGENQHVVPGGFRSNAEIPVLTDFYGEIMPQIVEQAGRLAMSGAEELRLRLQPEFLGEVLIRVRRLQGVLTAEIVAQDLAVRELLASQLDTLRQRFQEVNLPVEQLTVFVQAEGEQGSAFAGDADAQVFPDLFKAGREGAVENVVAEEGNGVLSPAPWDAGRRVNYLV